MSAPVETPRQGPAEFTVDDPTVIRLPETAMSPDASETAETAEPLPTRSGRPGLGTIAVAAAVTLLVLAIGVDIVWLIDGLLTSSPVVGWLAAGIAGILCLALGLMVLREIGTLARLRRVDSVRQMAEQAVTEADRNSVDAAVSALETLYSARTDTSWTLARFRERRPDVVDPADALVLFETEVLRPLDEQATAVIARTAKITAVVTAISPFAAVDILLTAWRNLAMVRQLAGLYGGRPGLAGTVKLMRRIFLHMALTGGMEAGDGLAGEMLGGGVAGKLSARLGQGVVNGLLTTRVGIAAIRFCRPLPFLKAPKPKVRDMAAMIAEDLRRRA